MSSALRETSPFLDAEATLAAAVTHGVLEEAAVLAAIALLEQAPLHEEWDSALMLGLLIDNRAAVDRTIAACMLRFRQLSDTVAQDALVEKLLSHCFTSLSASPTEASGRRTGRDQIERSAAKLIDEITILLCERPFEHEQHRSRLLSHARRIQHIQGSGELSEAVVRFLDTISGDPEHRSDHEATVRLTWHRKLELYESLEASEAALLSHLGADRRLHLPQLTADLLGAYRVLITSQSKERAPNAILHAIDNLAGWLEEIPYDGRRKLEILREMIGRAAMGVPFEELPLPVRRHLELHRELLPGPSHPEDLLRLARESYASNEGDEIFVRLLALFKRLPLIRFRVDDLSDLLVGYGHRSRSERAWRALLDLVESILTGLEEIVPSSDDVTKEAARINRARRELLDHDRRLRELLLRIATDMVFRVSDDPSVETNVRELAWRILLRAKPPDHFELLDRGLGTDPRLIVPTIEEASRAHRRALWRVVSPRWMLLTGAQATERRRRIGAIADAFRNTAPIDLIESRGDQPGPLLALALDDADTEVRSMIERAVMDAGYGIELDIVRQQRRLEALRNELAGTRQQIIAAEEEIDGLGDRLRRLDVERGQRVVEWQALRQRRAAIETESIIRTAELSVRFEELRIRTAEAIQRAEIEERTLRRLAGEVAARVREASTVAREIETLVASQRHEEQELASAQRELQHVRQAQHAAESAHRSAQNELRSVQGRSPSRPRHTSDPQEMQRRNDRYEAERAAHQRQLSAASERVASLDSRLRQLESQESDCAARISGAQSRLQTLARNVRIVDERRRAIETAIADLQRQVATHRTTWNALRAQIAELQRQTAAVAAEAERAQADATRWLAELGRESDAVRARIDGIGAELRTIEARLVQVRAERDRLELRARQLQHDFNSGLAHLEQLSEQSVPASARANRRGMTLEQQHDHDTDELQSSLVQYAAGVERALRHSPPPLTRTERAARRAETRRVQTAGR